MRRLIKMDIGLGAGRPPTARRLLFSVLSSTSEAQISNTIIQTRQLHQATRPQSRPRPRHASFLRQSQQTTIPINPPLQPPPSQRYSTTPPPSPPPEPIIHPLFDFQTQTWQYLLADATTHTAAIIDPVLDYDPCTRAITTRSADAILALVRSRGYTVSHILETHAHADHLSAAAYLRARLRAVQGEGKQPVVGIGKRIGVVQRLFGERYGVGREEWERGFDLLLEDGERVGVGGLEVEVMHLPGHTPDHVGYRVGNNVFCGDSLFHPLLGTARCDFPGGSAESLYRSAQKLLDLPEHVKIWTGHDYPANREREPAAWATVGEHKARNKHVRDGITQDEFVRVRMERDGQLAAPRLVHESLQVNIRAGSLPRADAVGMRALKIPVKVEGEEW